MHYKTGKCFIIAEAGVNHNGDIRMARDLVSAAKKAGADAIKFQSFHAEKIVTPHTKKASYQTRSDDKNQFEMLKKLELSDQHFSELMHLCQEEGIEFISTPYDVESVNFLADIGVKRFKIASADIVNEILVKAAAETGKQVIISCGMASLGEIERAVSLAKESKNHDLILLHCTTSYPTPFDQVNMSFLKTLKRAFGLPVGYSDHTKGIEISLMAVSMGAKVIEKHFTLDRNLPGPDHFASVEPEELSQLVTAVRNIENAFGTGAKILTQNEKENIFFMRRSLHAARDIKKGKGITMADLKIVRPNDGLPTIYMDMVIGRRAKDDISENQPITWESL